MSRRGEDMVSVMSGCDNGGTGRIETFETDISCISAEVIDDGPLMDRPRAVTCEGYSGPLAKEPFNCIPTTINSALLATPRYNSSSQNI